VGILGGTFNPPHIGHLALARSARAQLRLDRVLLMPANVAPNKPASPEDPGAGHRLRMCELACASEPGVRACAREIERGGVSYTVDTLQGIHEEHPDAELTLILGADTARTLPGWREPRRLLELARVAVAKRDGLDGAGVRDALADLVGDADPAAIAILNMRRIEVSSSQVRELVGAGEPVDDLVGERVARYIAEHRLYARGD
jgi:nicotinate-nucleotide adenylyltransferase